MLAPPPDNRHQTDNTPKRGPARLLALLVSLAAGKTTVTVTHRVLGAQLGAHRITVVRWEQKLVAAGLIEVQNRYANHRQTANTYRILDAQNCYTVCSTTSVCSSEEQEPREAILCSLTRDQDRHLLPTHAQAALPWNHHHHDAVKVVDYFAKLVGNRDGKITRESYRRESWLRTGIQLVVYDHRSVDEVLDAIDYSFTHTKVLARKIAREVRRDPRVKRDPRVRFWLWWGDGVYRPVRLTRLKQIANHLDLILNEMKRSQVLADPGQMPTDRGVRGEEESVQGSQTPGQDLGQTLADSHRPGVQPPLGSPLGSEEPLPPPPGLFAEEAGGLLEKQVDVLMGLFTRTKSRRLRFPEYEISDFDRSNWSDSFRIALARRKIPFTDIRLVVSALAEHKLEQLDYDRYPSPFSLFRDGEWAHISALVRGLTEAYQQRQESSPPPPPQLRSDDDFYERYFQRFGEEILRLADDEIADDA